MKYDLIIYLLLDSLPDSSDLLNSKSPLIVFTIFYFLLHICILLEIFADDILYLN